MQALGKAYESRAIRRICRSSGPWEFLKKPWIGYSDQGRHHAAQPDLLVRLPERIVIFEFKLTRCEEGFRQIEVLYAPLVWALFGLPLAGVQVFRNPGSEYDPHPNSPATFRDCLSCPIGTLSEWHFLI